MMFNKTWKLYEILDKMEKGRLKVIAMNMGWSERKTKRHLKKLIKHYLIREKNGIYEATPWYEFIDWNKMKNLSPEDCKGIPQEFIDKLKKK